MEILVTAQKGVESLGPISIRKLLSKFPSNEPIGIRNYAIKINE
jgi:hypothetical protein